MNYAEAFLSRDLDTTEVIADRMDFEQDIATAMIQSDYSLDDIPDDMAEWAEAYDGVYDGHRYMEGT